MTERVDFYVLKSAAAKQRWAFACRLTEKAYLKDLKIVIVNDTLADRPSKSPRTVPGKPAVLESKVSLP